MAPSKILAIKLRSLGDTVLMTAPIIELTRAFPHCEIDVLVPEFWAPLFENFPGIYQVFTLRRSAQKSHRWKEITRLTLELRKKKYDTVINFHASPSSAALARATGAKVRSIHFHGLQDKNRYSNVTIPGKGMLKPIIERDMDALRALGLHVPAGRMPRIFLQPMENRQAKERLHQMGLNQPVLALGLGASRPTKCWPIERFTSLAIDWCQKVNGSVLAIAGPSERDHAISFLKQVDDDLLASMEPGELRSKIRAKITILSDLNIRSLAAILAEVSVFVGNDSGPRHMAVAVLTPTVTLFGPEDPFEWHPYPSERHPYLYIESLACRREAAPEKPPWCGLTQCVTEEHRCMQQIGVASVLDQCIRLLPSPGTTA